MAENTKPEPSAEVRRLANKIHSDQHPLAYGDALVVGAARWAVSDPRPDVMQYLRDCIAAKDLASGWAMADLDAELAATSVEQPGGAS